MELENSALTILGQEVPTRRVRLRQSDLQFYPENPRIYSIVCDGGEEPSQIDVEERLAYMDHVKQLVQSIKANDGLVDPLLVRDGDLVVLEGNSRLAAYRLLAKKDPIKWGEVKCDLLPADMDDDLIFSLLGEYHIIGRKDWSPYEQAGYLWRRYREHGVEPKKMAEDMGLSLRKVNQLIEIYELMREQGISDVTKWSYYEEYVKSRHIRKAREDNPEMDQVIAKKIKSGEISKGVQVRKEVATISKVGGKTLNAFLKKPKSLDRCYEAAIDRGANNVWFNRLHAFRKQITEPYVKDEIFDVPENQLKKSKFELKKIKERIEWILGDDA